METHSLNLTDSELFKYKNIIFDTISIMKKELPHGKQDGVKYLLVGEVFGLVHVDLVKSYWSGQLVVNSPHHVKWMADKVKEVYGEIL